MINHNMHLGCYCLIRKIDWVPITVFICLLLKISNLTQEDVIGHQQRNAYYQQATHIGNIVIMDYSPHDDIMDEQQNTTGEDHAVELTIQECGLIVHLSQYHEQHRVDTGVLLAWLGRIGLLAALSRTSKNRQHQHT